MVWLAWFHLNIWVNDPVTSQQLILQQFNNRNELNQTQLMALTRLPLRTLKYQLSKLKQSQIIMERRGADDLRKKTYLKVPRNHLNAENALIKWRETRCLQTFLFITRWRGKRSYSNHWKRAKRKCTRAAPPFIGFNISEIYPLT